MAEPVVAAVPWASLVCHETLVVRGEPQQEEGMFSPPPPKRCKLVQQQDCAELPAAMACVEQAAPPPSDALLLYRRIGSGVYGDVFAARWRAAENDSDAPQTVPCWPAWFAVKRLKHEVGDEDGLRSIVRELTLSGLCGGDRLGVLRFVRDGGLFGLSMPLAACTLDDVLRDAGGRALPRALVLEIGEQLLTQLRDLHALGVMHRDIKPHNILLHLDGASHTLRARLTDFGLSSVQPTSCDEHVVTLWWRAPEVVLGLEYDHRVDVWALGLVLLQCLRGAGLTQAEHCGGLLQDVWAQLGQPSREAWPELHGAPAARALAQLRLDGLLQADGTPARVWEDVPDAAWREVLQGMLTACPAERWTASKALAHELWSSFEELPNDDACALLLQRHARRTAQLHAQLGRAPQSSHACGDEVAVLALHDKYSGGDSARARGVSAAARAAAGLRPDTFREAVLHSVVQQAVTQRSFSAAVLLPALQIADQVLSGGQLPPEVAPHWVAAGSLFVACALCTDTVLPMDWLATHERGVAPQELQLCVEAVLCGLQYQLRSPARLARAWEACVKRAGALAEQDDVEPSALLQYLVLGFARAGMWDSAHAWEDMLQAGRMCERAQSGADEVVDATSARGQWAVWFALYCAERPEPPSGLQVLLKREAVRV